MAMSRKSTEKGQNLFRRLAKAVSYKRNYEMDTLASLDTGAFSCKRCLSVMWERDYKIISALG